MCLVFPWQQITHDIWLLSFGIESVCLQRFGGVPVYQIVLWSVQSATRHIHIQLMGICLTDNHTNLVWFSDDQTIHL